LDISQRYFFIVAKHLESNIPLLILIVFWHTFFYFNIITELIYVGIYEPRGINVPNPIQTVCTRWGSDFLSYGSYSNVAVEASGDDYDVMAESVGNG
jgi:hypothetical protein